MLHIIACDDEKDFLELMEVELKQRSCGQYSFTKTGDIDHLEKLLQKNPAYYDVMLMDIKMYQSNGIDLAAQILKYCQHLKVIFITGYLLEYYEGLFLQLRPFGALSKPVDWNKLILLLENAGREDQIRRYLPVKCQTGIVNVDLDHIRYIESIKRITVIHMREELIRFYGSLTGLKKSLPSNFLQCHKSFIVNMDYIKMFYPGEIVMQDDSVIAVSRNRAAETKAEYFTYIGMGL